MLDRSEWLDRKPKHKVDGAAVRQLIQAVPKMENLTNSEEWDKFLSYIKVEIDAAEQAASALIEEMLLPSQWDATELVRIKAAVLVLRDRASILNAASAMPKKIIEAGKRAEEAL